MYKFIMLLFLLPLIGYGQFHIQKIKVDTKFAYGGDFAATNNNLIYIGINNNINPVTMEGLSLRLRNMETNKETIIVANIFLSDPYYGWLDESHLFYEKDVSLDKFQYFGTWKSQLVKYNIHTQNETILPFDLLNSENRLSNIKIANHKIYFLNKNKVSDKYILEEYNLENLERITIKTFDAPKFNQILGFELFKDKNSIVYIEKEKNKTNFIEINLITRKETIIKSIDGETFIDGSTSFGSFFYYFERRRNSNDIDNFENSYYVIKSLNVNNKKLKSIKSFDKGIEISRIDMLSFNEMIISMQSGTPNSIDVAITEDIQIELSSNSNLYLFKF